MAAIRSRNTQAELLLRQALRTLGVLGYRVHHPALPGKPDIVYTRWRIAVFVDGAYWHGHPDHYSFGKLGRYWDDKIRRTQERDRQQEAALREMGYRVVRFWDFDVKKDPVACAKVIASAIRTSGSSRTTRAGPPESAS